MTAADEPLTAELKALAELTVVAAALPPPVVVLMPPIEQPLAAQPTSGSELVDPPVPVVPPVAGVPPVPVVPPVAGVPPVPVAPPVAGVPPVPVVPPVAGAPAAPVVPPAPVEMMVTCTEVLVVAPWLSVTVMVSVFVPTVEPV